MSAGKFWLLTFLAGVIALLILIQIACEQQASHLTTALSKTEAGISQARQQNELLRQLVQRIAVESQHDPALTDLLAKRGLHLKPANGSAAPPAPATPPPQ